MQAPARPRLIVNGDDLGRSESVTRGILRAHREGVLTSASIVAGGAAFELAAELASGAPELGVGVHLVLDEYPPCAEPSRIRSLLDAEGAFRPRAAQLARALARRIDPGEVLAEWEAQLRRVRAAGIRPTHLDGHGHLHAAPGLPRLVVALARRFEVGAVRLPAEAFVRAGALRRFSLRRQVEKALLRLACAPARRAFSGALAHPDAFFGFGEGGRLDAEALRTIARSLSPGVSELMTHPGASNDDPYGLAYDMAGELDALVGFDRATFEREFRVELVSYATAWS